MEREFRDRENLILDAGQEIRFPVDPTDPISRFQTFKEIESMDDVADFEFVKLWRHLASKAIEESSVYGSFYEDQKYFYGLFPNEAGMLAEIQKLGSLMQIVLGDFIVPVGATVILSNVLNTIDANRVIISGTLKVEGHIVINAKELGG